ncbi:heat shock protein Hsp90 family protein [Tieghemostelium lacteum]|uniref:Heat shock protein Hsp90 family protein n=1 Tax=Tieghemostelium lacteum TaxID=361077 RepID=A0A151ZK36_TIELA|nr:heat shock protein Hsp90 family protein [Tieghemostelium lacteum]|eukprot:KYQ94343.1 heat shock protein Hsp90 family protein [Tieghemostelium lacteum]
MNKTYRLLLTLSLVGLLLALSTPSTYADDSITSEYTAEEQKLLKENFEQHTFQTEVNKLMNIIINSLYSKKEIFLRELISNASDALDKIRFLALTNPSLLGEGDTAKLEIRIQADPNAKTLTILDKGIGMTKADLIKNLGTIAQSGTKDFIQKLTDSNDPNNTSNLIGQFGVGFYSLFLVADSVVVTSKHNDDDQYIWTSDSHSSFNIAKDPKGNTLGRGTKITLHIKEDSAEFLQESTIKDLIKKYSQFINFPIYLYTSKEVEQPEEPVVEEAKEFEGSEETKVEIEEGEEVEEKEPVKKEPVYEHSWEELNDVKPLWTKSSKEITDEEYNKFYQSLSKTSEDPIAHSHFTVSGDTEFKSIIYIPKTAPQNMFDLDNAVSNIKLFVRRVFITDNLKDLVPNWLRFLVGVIDSDDLPINVSREMLQQHKTLDLIKSKITRKFVALVQEIFDREDKSDYKTFFKAYGTNMKLGVIEDKANKNRLMKLLMFHSSKEEWTTLDEYISRMKEGQEQIYFIAGKSIDSLENSPLIEQALKKGYEVLYLIDPIDEYLVGQNQKYESKSLTNLAREGVKFNDEAEEDKESLKQLNQEYKPLTDFLRKTLSDKVDKVTVSKILADSPAVLVSNQWGVTANMERIMKAQSVSAQEQIPTYMNKKIMEINPDHQLIKQLLARIQEHGTSDEISKISANVLYETSALSSGYSIDNPKSFSNWVYKIMTLSGEKLSEVNYEAKYDNTAAEQPDDLPEMPDINFNEPPANEHTPHDEL